MSNNYFSIERDGECWMPMVLADKNGAISFEEFLDMSYDEMRENDKLSDFIVAAMNAANRKSDNVDSQTLVTLIGEDDVFIWSIIIGVDQEDSDFLRYSIIDWKKDDKRYRYEK